MMTKVISFDSLARKQHLNFLKHKGREYREREEYLGRVRKLLFQVEAQMRQAEIQQLEVFRELADHFRIPFTFPDQGDRLALQQFFATHPFLLALQGYFAGRLSAEECYEKIMGLASPAAPPKE
jgi:hypothetical protein